MAKVSPIVRSLNGGEFSPLMEGRTDLDKYPASTRAMLNSVAAPQGPGIGRSGTMFVGSRFKPNKQSYLIPFEAEDEQQYQIEFTDGRVRFFTDTGLLVHTPVDGTLADDTPFKIDSATLGASVGDQVSFSGFPDEYNLNGIVGNVVGVAGTVFEFDTVFPALPDPGTVQVALVYHVVSPYTDAQSKDIEALQSVDVMYLFHPTIKTYKLSRSNTYSWAFTVLTWVDGPYMDINETGTSLTPSARGVATPTMTANAVPSGVASGSSVLAGKDYYMAFDTETTNTFWSSDVAQTGIIQYQAAVAFTCDGYAIYLALDNADANFSTKDYGPSTFTFEGSNDGATWVVLDKQNDYVLYDNNKSVFFPLKNATAYLYHRLNILNVTRNGVIKPRVRSLVMRSTTSVSMTLTASAAAGINNGQGFLATDVGRLIRMKGSDQTWRPLVITARASTTSITVTLLGEPFVDLQPITDWRLGYWSDTTGYPNVGAFYQDRLWAMGSTAFPNLVAGSMEGQYEKMSQTSDDGTVLDTHAVVVRLNSRKLSRPRWAEENTKGLLLGTGSKEYVITSAEGSDKNITPSNVKATPAGSRGSYATQAISVDDNTLFVPRGGRGLREFAYQFQSDGFKAPNMLLLSSHLGVSPFVKIVYAAEPYSIVWVLRDDGKILGLTYNRDESVVGWHRHDFPAATTKSISVMPSTDQLQDTLWMVNERLVDGVTQGYIEKLTRFWDFGMTIDDAHFVDCALRYSGAPVEIVYGLSHLEGLDDVYGLADGIPIGPLTIADGSTLLNEAASEIIIGIGFDTLVETSRLENGAQDGTAQGKVKRINNVSFMVWESYGGEVGTWNDDEQEVKFTPLEYPPVGSGEVETISLFTGIVGPTITQPGYEKQGSVSFRRRKESPLPLNVVAIMPQMNTQDR